ncbi:MAG: MFS transporter [Pseudonocardiaceae bacterium]|nr:MFS transporter [Pseudonocardiaceae bacterium]
MPAFGIALAYTLVTTYVPVLLNQLSGPAITGILIGGEGVLALIVPVLVGNWSDSLRSRLGGRLPFVLAGSGLAVAALVLLPLGTGSLVFIAVALGGFFIGYFVYYAPYYALYPDLVPEEARGRSQGFQGTLRSAGLLLGLSGGGFLLSLWHPLPFVVGAAAVVATTAGLYAGVRHRVATARSGARVAGGRNGFVIDWQMLRGDRAIRLWAVANACWEGAIAALRTFVVLYFTVGLGFSLHGASAALALVGGAALVAAPVAGKLADRYGPRRVMQVAVWLFALGLAPPLLTTNTYFIAAIVPVAFAAVVLMTLPYAVLMGLLPENREHGAGASLFGLSRGFGVIIGPLLAGGATSALSSVGALSFDDTKGYSSIFAVAMVLLLASTPLLRRIPATGPGQRSGGP